MALHPYGRMKMGHNDSRPFKMSKISASWNDFFRIPDLFALTLESVNLKWPKCEVKTMPWSIAIEATRQQKPVTAGFAWEFAE